LIPQAYIIEWRSVAPWISDAQIEQDLIICRSLLSLFSNKLVAENLAFRGGTALHKLFLQPPSRYSEDIDLVQIKAGPIGYVIDAVHEVLDNFLGISQRKQGQDTVTLTYRVESEIQPIVPLKLKVEINTREHFSVLGYLEQSFSVNSRWHSGSCKIKTYKLEELLGTKLRALYQRRKGRDLFDLWLGLTLGKADPSIIVKTFQEYMLAERLSVSQKEYRKNLVEKMKKKAFLSDTDNLLRTAIKYDPDEAFQLIDKSLLMLL
jgi:predicted nucleotidyltransferase component of viral defense system